VYGFNLRGSKASKTSEFRVSNCISLSLSNGRLLMATESGLTEAVTKDEPAATV